MNKRDALLLTLHKQHYMDKHTEPYVSRISCLGYYDAISIDVVESEEAKDPLTKSTPFNPFSNIWYRTGKRNASLSGGYSNLSVALLRGIEVENDYWEREYLYPYFGIGFIKLDDPITYDALIAEIESEEFLEKESDECCKIINYCTLDSADIVVLIKSNKLSLIEKAFCQIEKKVSYLHSILGVDEAFLDKYYQCFIGASETENIIETGTWNGTNCNVDEPIESINIRLAAKGSDTVRNSILQEWNKQQASIKFSDIKYSYVLGHANLSIDIKETNVESLVRMLVVNGFLTHTNSLYQKGVYNIETTCCIKGERIDEPEKVDALDEIEIPEEKKNWYCDQVLKEYEDLINGHPIKKDDGFYSYTQALLLTLNAVAQYEKFEMSKDLFWLIYPSLHMFNAHMIENWKGLNATSSEYIRKMTPIKKALCDYLESVNSVIYHTVHTDQVYLMIPGYSGTSFSIPIKLSLFYMWFVNKIITILNDNNREYSCILTPVMEAKPSTGVIDIDKSNSNKIIYVRLSQRQLYFPRNLMVILAHELGHYVGKDIRCRTARAEHILKVLAYCICEGMLPEKNPFVESEIWDVFLKSKKTKLQKLLLTYLYKEFEKNRVDTEYYAVDIRENLKRSVLNVISENVHGKKISKFIYEISDKLKEYAYGREDGYIERLKEVYEVQSYVDHNRKEIVATGLVNFLVDDIITIYQEIYSDVVALEVLQCNYVFAEEAFGVSEGVVYSDNSDAPQNIIRKRIMGQFAKTNDAVPLAYYGKAYAGDITKYLKENLFSFNWLEDSLITYAQMCQAELQTRLGKNQEIKKEVEEIRKVYDCFIKDEISLGELYQIIIEKNNSYMYDIKIQYEEHTSSDGG